jgi:hypothetical protein
MRADPADPGGMGSTGPAIEDGGVTQGHAAIPLTSGCSGPSPVTGHAT